MCRGATSGVSTCCRADGLNCCSGTHSEFTTAAKVFLICTLPRSCRVARAIVRAVRLGVVGVSLTATALLPIARAQNNLPSLGDSAAADFSLATERNLGDAIMRDIRRDPHHLDDPILLEYLQSLWQPLLAAAKVRGDLGEDLSERFPYQPFLVRDPSVNAFALPGGYMGVHLGLMAITQTRDELASVLAHEMTHINQRHIARGFANSRQQSLISVAATILGVIAATQSGGGDAAGALITSGQAVGIQGQLNFSRDMEREADRIGASVMASAGFDPAGMASMFERLQKSSRLNDSGNFPYLRSHPLTTARIGEARARLEAGEAGSASALPTTVLVTGSIATPLEHTAALARARVLMDPRAEALQRWQRLDAANPAAEATRTEQFADAYSAALASSLLRDWSRADASIKKALNLALGAAAPGGAATAYVALPPDRRAIRAVLLLATESQLERGDALRAQSTLARLMRPAAGPVVADSTPTSRPVMLFAAKIALALNTRKDDEALRQVSEQLQTWVARYPSDPEAWAMLGRVSAQFGWGLRSLRAEAESHYAMGDLRGAIDRLRAGQNLARSNQTTADFVESSVIDSRLRVIEAQRKQLLTEQLGYQ